MTEKQTSNEDSKFNGKALGAAAAIIGVGAAWASGSALHTNELANDRVAAAQENQETKEAYYDSIAEAVNAQYDAKSLVGEVSVEQGGSLGDASLALIEEALGEDVYKDIKGRIYSPLIDSAKQFNPQPGETFSIVEVDLNPDTNDGNEYIVTKPNHIIHPSGTEIPSPDTH